MVSKTLIDTSIGIAIGLSPLKNSQLAKIIITITGGQNVRFNLIISSATYVFPGGRALQLVKNGVNITNSINPLILAKNITLSVIDCFTSPLVRLVAFCS